MIGCDNKHYKMSGDMVLADRGIKQLDCTVLRCASNFYKDKMQLSRDYMKVIMCLHLC